ncbi:MAG: hypothetical protein KUG67_03140 [Proteobacteria bacterium]|nr:hypothetical protein [Pseudomonadota bacterium]
MIALALCMALAAGLGVGFDGQETRGDAAPTNAAPKAWRYVVPPEGAKYRRPTLVAVPLTDVPPDLVATTAVFKGQWQRYGMLRFGDLNSTRVAIALDFYSPTRADLYVDATRDLSIDAVDLIASDALGGDSVKSGSVQSGSIQSGGRAWELSLAVATLDARGRQVLSPRRVAIELGSTGMILGAATLGWLEGRVELKGDPIAVRRRDGDANGSFGDQNDQLWLDLDADGGFDLLEELFVVQPILSLKRGRFALRSNLVGSELRLDELEGAGHVKLSLLGAEGVPREDLEDVQALLVGRDGSAVLTRVPGEPTEVPIGEYRLSMLTLRVADGGGAAPWNFVFTTVGSSRKTKWHEVQKDVELVLDPLGELRFSVRYPTEDEGLLVGVGFTACLELFTGDGLLINNAFRGRDTPTFGSRSIRSGVLSGRVSFIDQRGDLITQSSTGFL